jgi:hypothetical protein
MTVNTTEGSKPFCRAAKSFEGLVDGLRPRLPVVILGHPACYGDRRQDSALPLFRCGTASGGRPRPETPVVWVVTGSPGVLTRVLSRLPLAIQLSECPLQSCVRHVRRGLPGLSGRARGQVQADVYAGRAPALQARATPFLPDGRGAALPDRQSPIKRERRPPRLGRSLRPTGGRDVTTPVASGRSISSRHAQHWVRSRSFNRTGCALARAA